MSGFDLPGHGVIRIEGRDAAAFLQAQLAGDLRPLADGGRQWNCYLTPQGRVQSVFVLGRESAERFTAHVPEGLAAAVAERLRRYVLRSKVTLAVDQPEPVDAVVDGLRRLSCIAVGIPTIGAAVTDQFTPNALSLERLAAFSTAKGCYPGQEIVARTHFLGRSKRALARLALEPGTTAAAGAQVLGADGAVAGTVVSASGAEALAVLHESASAGALTVDAGGSIAARRLDFDQLRAP